MAIFQHSRLKNGVNLFVHPTKKFKTILVQLIFHRHLREEDVTSSALLPSVLERGSVNYPTRRQLAERLEELYGTELMADVSKKGERQMVTFSLDLVHDQYLPGESKLLRQALEILSDVVLNPLTEDDGFKADFVRQEKEQHEKVIKGLINDKMAYSVDRCLQAMCQNEPFGVFKYGTVERLKEIDASGLYRFYQRFLAESPLDLHITGDVDAAAVKSLADEVFAFERSKAEAVPPTDVKTAVADVRYVREELDVNQGKLVMGFRTGLSYADDDYFPLLVYNGILGAFPHSKLFQNVREKASLAYYAYSRLEKHKGLMVVSSGIEMKNYDQALDIIRKQVDDMVNADFSEEVFANTIVGLRNQFLVEEDSPGLMVNRALDGMLAGRHENTDELVKRLDNVTPEDVARVAGQVKLDTVYFLTGKGGAK
ncbi:EF-P 5-aminopentanol modification-associated protein YfmF [Dethiobacter alkaliphilus]|uniref:EF-P 5-aminopentanol modification-associated protein YfmF n=1 Tax=Dethiobacter alkaliphilus TaxID=427926 RepID=UPI00222770F5|nr:pitrilysin family protein [Dethiobacter alkaliphilus]MCW3490101.1 insulinase family protein [Dethiobacter alkaliphilus]